MTKKRLLLFSVLSLIVFLGAGCDDGNASDEAQNTVDIPVVEKAEKTIYRIGDEASVGEVTYQLTAIQLFKKEIPLTSHNYPETIGKPLPADKGRDWLRVQFTLTNAGTETVALFGSNFIVENAAGQRIESSNDVTNYAPIQQNPVLASDIQPGAAKDYVVYFDIPEKSQDLVFEAPNPADAFTSNVNTVTFAIELE
jgi:hypothetical protein